MSNIESKELYHLHVPNNHDDKWKVNSSFVVNDSFDSRMNKRYNGFRDVSKLNNVDVNSYMKMAYIFGLLEQVPISELSKCIDLGDVKNLCKEMYDILFNASCFKRETAMEAGRIMHNPTAPSRLHCLYLTDEQGIEYWKQHIQNPILYRVEVKGNIFLTNEQLIPNELLSYEDMLSSSIRYWKPKNKNLDPRTNEYLVQGQVLVKEKISHF